MAEANDDTCAFIDKAEAAFRELFEAAKQKNELDFVMSLCPEFRGEQGPGWCTWEETNRAFDEYLKFLNEGPMSLIKMRIALSFYSHLSEASGFYECPKNLLRVAGGDRHRLWPFLELNRKHHDAGTVIAPNSNKIFRDLIGHAKELGLLQLVEVFRDAFDPDIRNGYAHADYILWTDGLRLRRQAGGHPRIILWHDFDQALLRAINFYSIQRQLMMEYLATYREPRIVHGSMGGGPSFAWRIEIDHSTNALRITST